jgi:hypothetical protein
MKCHLNAGQSVPKVSIQLLCCLPALLRECPSSPEWPWRRSRIAESGLKSRTSGAIRARSGREGFGFSNDAGRSKKALSFNEAKFDLPPTGCRTVRIVLKYEHGEVTDQCLYRGNIMVRG